MHDLKSIFDIVKMTNKIEKFTNNILQDLHRIHFERKMLKLARLELIQRAKNHKLYDYEIEEIQIGRYLYVPKDLTHCPAKTNGQIGVVIAIDIENSIVTLEHNIVNKIIAKYDLNIWVKL